ncbi:hypothetical protein [Acidilobus sp.]|uniref:hypothetical protein n=1 Tax=Acidilobus sp. TaxID=1872109 RepID=UPI003D03C189
METRRALAAAASLLLIAAILLYPATSLAEGVHVNKSNYIYVYPNSAVVVVVNGTASLEHEAPRENLSLEVTYYSTSTYLRLAYSGQLPKKHVHFTFGGMDELEGSGPGLQSLNASGFINRTSNGRVSQLRLNGTVAVVGSEGQFEANLSLYRLIEAVTSPSPEYVITLNVNVSHTPYPAPIQLLKYESLNTTGINITELKVYENSTFTEVLLKAVVNATPAPPNTTLGLVQALIGAALTPGFINGSYHYYVNYQARVASGEVSFNASNDLIGLLGKALAGSANALAQQGDLQEGVDLGDYGGSLGELIDNAEPFLNATSELISYIQQNFRVVVPSTEEINVTSYGHNVSFSFRSPMIIKANAKSPKDTLVAIQYLFSNASQFYEQNGLDHIAKAFASVEGEEVTLVGVDGVTVRPSQTTIGNLSSVTVTVPSGSAPAKEVIGGSAVVVSLLLVAFFLLRRH